MSREGRSDEVREDRESAERTLAAEVLSVDGKRHRVVLDRSRQLIEFTFLGEGSKGRCSMQKDLNELLSVRGSQVLLRRGVPANLMENAEVTPSSLFFYFAEKKHEKKWRIMEIIALFSASNERNHWQNVISSALRELKQRPKSLIVFVNPYGGKRQAKKIYFTKVKLILELAGISCKLILTERANHALDTLRSLDAREWTTVDGVVSVGGDGLFNECLSAIVIRSQDEAGKDVADVNVDSLVTPRMRFGIIGAGSANSIVMSVHGTDDCPTAAIHIAIGSQCFVDVCTVHRGGDLMRISANAISFGWLGDVLADSERFRWMGPFRYNYAALRTTAINPAYFGRISFRLITEVEGGVPVKIPKCTGRCSLCASNEAADGAYPHHIQGDFSHVICCVIPCVSPFTPYGLAPYAGVGDGSMDLAVVPHVTRCGNMTFLRRVAMHGGRYVVKKRMALKVYRVSRWAFTPGTMLGDDPPPHPKRSLEQGTWNLDGEIMYQPTDATLHFRLHPQLIKYFGRELDLNQKSMKRGCCGCGSAHERVTAIVSVGRQ